MDRRRSPSYAMQGSSAATLSGSNSSTSTHSGPRLKQSIPKQIDVPSFSAFQAQTPRVLTASPVRRKPLPSASPAVPPLSTGGKVVAIGEGDYDDLFDNEPQPTQTSHRIPWLPTPQSTSPTVVVRDLDQFPRGQSPFISKHLQPTAASDIDHQRGPLDALDSNASSPTKSRHISLASDSSLHDHTNKEALPDPEGLQQAATMSLHPTSRPPPLRLESNSRSFSSQSHDSHDSTNTSKPQRSPGPNKLTSFFGWRTSSPVPEHVMNSVPDRNHSSTPSPLSPSLHSLPSSSRSLPHAIDTSKASGAASSSYFSNANLMIPKPSPGTSILVGEMEDELREISSELAGSIRREMELEDLVERLQSEATQVPELNRRTSDYYSDSGTSSVSYPLSKVGESKPEDLEKLKRRSEQEKAQLKLDTSQKLQDERERRKGLELHIQHLEEQVQQIDQERVRISGTAGRARELEVSLEHTRRQLLEERQVKNNFEDLLAALQDEIEKHRNERDNLRDKVVPGLQTRVKGLETDSAELQRLISDNTRMQQEIQSLRNENSTLVTTRKLQLDVPPVSPRFNSIAEEGGPSPTSPGMKMGLGRSNTIARSTGMAGALGGRTSRAASLSRSNSVSGKERESRESLADRVKDIEMQRDALHHALKGLLERQKYQKREHAKRIRALESEKAKLAQSSSPRRLGYEKEVLGLREEINHLRHRADDALEQKWRCEKGLGGLKMDLDRAEQETTSLRTLLHEHDILVPEFPGNLGKEIGDDTQASSASLEKAYSELQAAQATSATRLRQLCQKNPAIINDPDIRKTMSRLDKSMPDAKAEYAFTEEQAIAFRAKTETLDSKECQAVADQLRSSADRFEALAVQVRSQLEANNMLRDRLAEAVGKGEREQKASAVRINGMQGRLKGLEERLTAAQQHSEDTITTHEEEVKEIKESTNTQLQRHKGGLTTPTAFTSPDNRSPLSPLFLGASKSPRLDKTRSGVRMNLNEALQTEFLERKVVDLERALAEADGEMEEVVQRMNLAQIEVMELQSERDEAIRQTKKLQAAITVEREKVDKLMSSSYS